MKNSLLKTFFTYSKNQQRGIVVLSITLLAMIVFLSVDHLFYETESEIDRSAEVKAFLAGVEKQETARKEKQFSKHKPYAKKEKKSKQKLNLQPFDPNLITVSELKAMGISNHIAKNFENYRQKVGPFKTKEDVKSLYTVNDHLYAQLEQFIAIKTPEKTIPEKAKEKPVFEKAMVLNLNINTADTSDLQKIKGIGPYFAKQIVKYRNALGGFHSETQFEEVYKLNENELSLNALKENSFIAEASWDKININSIDREKVKKHPYFWGNFGKVFVNFCEVNSPFKNVEEIKECHLVTDEIYLKIAPYLKLN